MSEKINVLYINDYFNGGGAEKVFTDTLELMKSYVRVFYFTSPDSKKKASDLGSFFFNDWDGKILNIIQSEKIDIVHIHNLHNRVGLATLRAIRKARKLGCPLKVVFTAHDFFLLWANPSFCYFDSLGRSYNFKHTPNRWDFLSKKASQKTNFHSLGRKLIWFAVRGIMTEIDLIISPSVFLQNWCTRKFGDKKVCLIRNPHPSAGVHPIHKNATTTARKMMIVFLGRLSPEKGLLEFLGNIKGIDGIELHIVGDGPIKNKIQQLVNELDLVHVVKIKDRVSYNEKDRILPTYDALVLPSLWYENAPLTIVEAAYANLRIITMNQGGMRELAELCGGSYLIDPDDKTSYFSAVENCYHDWHKNVPIQRDKSKIKDTFDPEIYRDTLVKRYNLLTSSQQS